jgi:cytochrome b6-f complex iron-sulfur subunit
MDGCANTSSLFGRMKSSYSVVLVYISYLIVKEDKTLESFGLNAVCTHLGCVVPWSAAQNKFMCPCHGSQYAPDGHVVRGPAPLPLALAHTEIAEDGKILFTTWTEPDFRTGGKGWWN